MFNMVRYNFEWALVGATLLMGLSVGACELLVGQMNDPGTVDHVKNDPTEDPAPTPQEPPAPEVLGLSLSSYQADRYTAAMDVLNRNGCIACHASRSEKLDHATDLDWTNAPKVNLTGMSYAMVQAGSPLSSALIRKLKKPSGVASMGAASETMPQGGAAISLNDYNTLVDWISLISKPRTKLINIPAGTTGDWNTLATTYNLTVGDTMRVRNQEAPGGTNHTMHMNGSNSSGVGYHGPQTTTNAADGCGGGQYYERTLTGVFDSTTNPANVYEHFGGTSKRIFMKVSP